MAGRPKIFDENEILDKAIEVFWLKGYEAASADDLLTAMGIGKGSFYLSFKGGKKELYEKCLERFSNRSAIKFKENLSRSKDPIKFIKDFFLALADSTREMQLKGCYLGNAIIEMTNTDSKLKKKASDLLAELEKRFTVMIKDAQDKKLLATREDPALLARMLINLWNGINLTRIMYPESKMLKPMIELQLGILK